MDRPKLRKVERYADTLNGESVLILRDPLDLSEPVAVDAEFGEVLDMLDGTRTLAQVRQSLLMRGSHDLAQEDLASFVESLGGEGLLEDDRFRERFETLLELFADEEPRSPRAAGVLYPAEPAALQAVLRAALPDPTTRVETGADVVGVMVPHAPIDTTAAVLDATLRGLPAASELDLVVVLGTDHMPGLLPFAITTKRYGTLLGPVPADIPTVDALRRRLPWVDREEIRHRGAHSIEVAALLLRWIYGERCPPMLPLLCGQTGLRDGVGEAPMMAERFIADLEAVTEQRRILWWGSAELSHAGQAYGRPPLTESIAADVEARDRSLLSMLAHARVRALREGAIEAFPQGRPSGGAVMATLCQVLPPGFKTTLTHYGLVPAPGGRPGRLGLAGVQFRRAGSLVERR